MPITVTSTVKINQAVLDRLSEAAVQALIKTGDAVMTQVKNTEVMPFDTGTLQNDSTFLDTSQADSGLVRIVSSTPYARRLYFHPEYRFRTTNNMFAGAYWFKPWSGSGLRRDFIPRAFARFCKGLMKS